MLIDYSHSSVSVILLSFLATLIIDSGTFCRTRFNCRLSFPLSSLNTDETACDMLEYCIWCTKPSNLLDSVVSTNSIFCSTEEHISLALSLVISAPGSLYKHDEQYFVLHLTMQRIVGNSS